jgi:hypothetical protein
VPPVEAVIPDGSVLTVVFTVAVGVMIYCSIFWIVYIPFLSSWTSSLTSSMSDLKVFTSVLAAIDISEWMGGYVGCELTD